MMNIVLGARRFDDAPRDGNVYVRKNGTWIPSAGAGTERTEVPLTVGADHKVTLGTAASHVVTIDGLAASLMLPPPPAGDVRDTVLRAGIVNGGSLALPARGYRRFGAPGPYTDDVDIYVRQYGTGDLPKVWIAQADAVLPDVVRGTVYTDVSVQTALGIGAHNHPKLCVCAGVTPANDTRYYILNPADNSDRSARIEAYYTGNDVRVAMNGAEVALGVGTIAPNTPYVLLVDFAAGLVRYNGVQVATFTGADVTYPVQEDFQVGDALTNGGVIQRLEIGNAENMDAADYAAWEADAAAAAGVTL